MDSILKKNFFARNLLNHYNRKATRYDIPKSSFTSSKQKSILWTLQKLDHLGKNKDMQTLSRVVH